MTASPIGRVTGVEFDDPVLESAIREGLETVEAMLRRSVESADPFVTEAASHLVAAGGKRVRPLLALLASQFGDAAAPQIVPAAVVVELTHLATLYHDDVMDEASLRRGSPSANKRWDNTIAILTGDYLFARASDLLADLGPEAVRIQARTFARLVEGQIRETVGPAQGEDAVEHHLSVVADKTGSLIATSGRFGALFAGASADEVEVLTSYGQLIGVAFQLSDDIIDVASETGASGKTPGTDLREGIATLPVLYALRSGGAQGDGLRAALDAAATGSDQAVAQALALLRAHPAMDEARATLATYADEAKAAATELPDGSARQALETLADFVVARTG
ncbi:MAG: polyprenyl synthetase family protein [Mycobacteriales bacterium]